MGLLVKDNPFLVGDKFYFLVLLPLFPNCSNGTIFRMRSVDVEDIEIDEYTK